MCTTWSLRTVIDQHNADQFTLLRNQVLMGLRGLTEHIIGVIFGYTATQGDCVDVSLCGKAALSGNNEN